jgi:hypothetical protein
VAVGDGGDGVRWLGAVESADVPIVQFPVVLQKSVVEFLTPFRFRRR